jgi:LysR family transcriptional regulator, transcriptional activator for dmlA
MNEPSLNVDLQTLRSFCEVAARSSFSQAAERMGVSQAAVSKSISRLETHLHVVLFKRSTAACSCPACSGHWASWMPRLSR